MYYCYHLFVYCVFCLVFFFFAKKKRVNLAKGSMALRGFITLDPVALASFCKSTQSNT